MTLAIWALGIFLAILLFIPACLLIWHAFKGLIFALFSPLALIWNAVQVPNVKRGYDPRRFVHTAEELSDIQECRSTITRYENALGRAEQTYRQTPKNKDGQVDQRYAGVRDAVKTKNSAPDEINRLRRIMQSAEQAPFQRAQKFVAPVAYVEAFTGMWAATIVLLPAGTLVHAWLKFRTLTEAAKYYAGAGFWSDNMLVGFAGLAILSATGLIGCIWFRTVKKTAGRIIIGDVNRLAEQRKHLPEWISGLSGALDERLATQGSGRGNNNETL